MLPMNKFPGLGPRILTTRYLTEQHPSIFPINCVPNTFSECVSLLICFQLLNFDYLVCFARFGCNEPSEKFRFGR